MAIILCKEGCLSIVKVGYPLLIVIMSVSSLLYGLAETEPVMVYGPPEISARTRRTAEKYKAEVLNGRLKQRTFHATDAIVRLAAYKLKRTGHKKESDLLLKEWKKEQSFFWDRPGIGSHEPISKWLLEQFKMWEFVLGKEVVHTLRLDDIHTINSSLRVIFSCLDDVDEIEYFLHLCHDDLNGYRGLLPVVFFWSSFWTCVGLTWQAGGYLYCSPISQGIEVLADQLVCPSVNNLLWKNACNK